MVYNKKNIVCGDCGGIPAAKVRELLTTLEKSQAFKASLSKNANATMPLPLSPFDIPSATTITVTAPPQQLIHKAISFRAHDRSKNETRKRSLLLIKSNRQGKKSLTTRTNDKRSKLKELSGKVGNKTIFSVNKRRKILLKNKNKKRVDKTLNNVVNKKKSNRRQQTSLMKKKEKKS
ncbi:unnamed protein product [Didymodactylos carnosus]|uniref:Uncharacterized protein n=1 Tax=Didymodactylos carnosus TaxID=1234261 RepID=A0A814EVH4_9BILA|nr:unnamed protein product [Didymodactylos carnosus]CAF0974551.1 unnamed protein product [Didymodactylos carnosus]CAF3510852.1 unnamed protein product [Didymodactylos carnosus]CAF3747423.1 unnamed protein product [Didymodactylos carnosus]